MDNETFWYIDAVEEAMCFGWIDSTTKKMDLSQRVRIDTIQIKRKQPELLLVYKADNRTKQGDT